MNPTFYSENDIRLYHHGILGMKWGVRRYQNKDGSLTTAGRAHYGSKSTGFGSIKRAKNSVKKNTKTSTKKIKLSDRQKTALKVGAVALGTALAVYGGYKLSKSMGRAGWKQARGMLNGPTVPKLTGKQQARIAGKTYKQIGVSGKYAPAVYKKRSTSLATVGKNFGVDKYAKAYDPSLNEIRFPGWYKYAKAGAGAAAVGAAGYGAVKGGKAVKKKVDERRNKKR